MKNLQLHLKSKKEFHIKRAARTRDKPTSDEDENNTSNEDNEIEIKK